MADVIEQVRAVTNIGGGEEQTVEVGTNRKPVGDGSARSGIDGPKCGKTRGITANVIEQIRSIADIRGRES